MILKRAQKDLLRKLSLPTVILIILLMITLTTPPLSAFVIILFSSFTSFFVYLIATFLIPKKVSIIIGVFIFFLLFLKAYDLLDTINFLILISLSISSFILLTQK